MMGIRVPFAYQPVVRHKTLKTTFTGLQHILSTAETLIHQYRGIKYATIPARFRQSQLFTSYRSSTDATRYGPICPQPEGKTVEEELLAFSGIEPSMQNLKQIEFECLNLNITCPGGLTPESRLPVMVWIHGGGDRGSGSHWLYDGGPLVQNSIRLGKPIILVTINYRLGLLGCVAGPTLLEDNRLSGEVGVGNYGLWDQRHALEWVHHFIAEFGGDGSNITLFGASTGASDILNHLNSRSNASYPLFARAIVQSPVIDYTVPSVELAGVHLCKIMSALHVSTIQELRKVPVDKLVNFTSESRTVDDGVSFKNGLSESRISEGASQSHLQVSEKLAAQCLVEQHIGDRHGTHPLRTGAKAIQILHHDALPPIPRPVIPTVTQQPVIIGDCGHESFVYGPTASTWTPTAVIRRVGAICQSVKRANALLRAYDISAHTPDDEFPERLLELINDARFAWPTHLTAESLRHSRSVLKDSSGVWRYVFDQEAPGSGIPQPATDLLYLFDTARPAFTAQSLIAAPDPNAFFPDHFDVDDDDDDDDEGVPFDNSAFEDDPSSNGGDLLSSIDQYQYMAVRDALQSRWLTFAYGAAPWSRDKVFVFGPEGEAGERGSNIFEGRRRIEAWRTALEPLGRVIVQKVGLELGNGPSGGAQLMQRQVLMEEQHQQQLYAV